MELRVRLAGAVEKGIRIISGDKAWERQRAAWKIRKLRLETAWGGLHRQWKVFRERCG